MSLAILDDRLPEPERARELETPFGPLNWQPLDLSGRPAIAVERRSPSTDPRATAFALQALGAVRALAIVRDAAVGAGAHQLLAPDDYLEFTSGRPTTFFESIGAGYIQQIPAYCPEIRQALLEAGAAEAGSLLVVDEQPPSRARDWWSARGIKLISTETQPEGALCREMERCYAVLVWPPDRLLMPFLARFLPRLPEERNCACGQSLAMARKLGKLPQDWSTLLGKDAL